MTNQEDWVLSLLWYEYTENADDLLDGQGSWRSWVGMIHSSANAKTEETDWTYFEAGGLLLTVLYGRRQS